MKTPRGHLDSLLRLPDWYRLEKVYSFAPLPTPLSFFLLVVYEIHVAAQRGFLAEHPMLGGAGCCQWSASGETHAPSSLPLRYHFVNPGHVKVRGDKRALPEVSAAHGSESITHGKKQAGDFVVLPAKQRKARGCLLQETSQPRCAGPVRKLTCRGARCSERR